MARNLPRSRRWRCRGGGAIVGYRRVDDDKNAGPPRPLRVAEGDGPVGAAFGEVFEGGTFPETPTARGPARRVLGVDRASGAMAHTVPCVGFES